MEYSLGIHPAATKDVAGSYDAEKKVLTIILFDHDPLARYLNQQWRTDLPPFSGDAMNAYNDGPLADGSQMGPFYELESVSPPAFLPLGHSATHKPGMKPFWEITDEEKDRCLAATTWYPANKGYFRGGGFSSQFVTRGGMPVTMCRLNLVKGLGPVLQLAEGYTIDLPPEVHEKLNERTDPTWPTTWFVPRCTGQGAFRDVCSVMAHWGANHGAISYGHIGADLITLASMLRIPVNMHNITEQQIFRPASWSQFASDHHACATYGPLYT